MENPLRKLPRCLYCENELHIRGDAGHVRCPACGREMEIARFTQEEKRLTDAVEAARRSSLRAEESVREAMARFERSREEAQRRLKEEAERRLDAVCRELDQLSRRQRESAACMLQNSFDMGEREQRAGRFEAAIGHYQRVLANSPEAEAEVHWRIVLCRYGVEYVMDRSRGRHVPTITHMIVDSFLTDADCIAAVQCARSDEMRQYYRREAQHIEDILIKYRNVRSVEHPYDVFISVKQGDEQGRPTRDSVVALKLHAALTAMGLHVFNSNVSLDAHAGEPFEPYIMAALMTSRIMLVVSSSQEYITAPWVRNEWRRFRWLRENEPSSDRLLIAYVTGMTARDIPMEMGDIQAIVTQSVTDPMGTLRSRVEQVFPAVRSRGGSESPHSGLLTRAAMALEQGDFDGCARFCERVLDEDPRSCRAYVLELCAQLQVQEESALACRSESFAENWNYRRALQFADPAYRRTLERYGQAAEAGAAAARLQAENERLKDEMARMTAPGEMQRLREAYEALRDECRSISEEKRSLAEALAAREREIEALSGQIDRYKRQAEELVSFSRSAMEPVETGGRPAGVWLGRPGLPRRQINLPAEAQSRGVDPDALLEKSRTAREQRRALESAGASGEPLNLSAGDAFQGIAAGGDRSAAVTQAGGVLLSGMPEVIAREAARWRGIVGIALGLGHVAALCADGTVRAAGDNDCGQCAVERWTDIAAVSAGDWFTLGMRRDGTAVIAGVGADMQRSVEAWTDLIQVAAGADHAVGLRRDGSVVTAGYRDNGQNAVDDWRDVVQISAADQITLGLRTDGTVLLAGADSYNRGRAREWTGIVAVAAGGYHIAGLREDGSVVAVGAGGQRQCAVEEWSDVLAIAAGRSHTLGLRPDGTVLTTCGRKNRISAEEIARWKGVVLPSEER